MRHVKNTNKISIYNFKLANGCVSCEFYHWLKTFLKDEDLCVDVLPIKDDSDLKYYSILRDSIMSEYNLLREATKTATNDLKSYLSTMPTLMLVVINGKHYNSASLSKNQWKRALVAKEFYLRNYLDKSIYSKNKIKKLFEQVSKQIKDYEITKKVDCEDLL